MNVAFGMPRFPLSTSFCADEELLELALLLESAIVRRRCESGVRGARGYSECLLYFDGRMMRRVREMDCTRSHAAAGGKQTSRRTSKRGR
jgi:hypothetical protein